MKFYKRELQALLEIGTHPNIVSFLGTALTEELKSVIVLELAQGSLEDIIYHKNYFSKGSFNDAEKYLNFLKTDCFVQIASGMEHIHSKNRIHFDLKPSNVLIFSDSPHKTTLKIADFATCYEKTELAVFGPEITSTAEYTAPELLSQREDSLSEKVDVFAFGMLLWECFHRDLPFGSKTTVVKILQQISNQEMPEIRVKEDKYRALIERCWSANPSSRPAFTEILRIIQD